MLDLAKSENDAELVSDTEKQIDEFEASLEQIRLSLMLNGEADNLPAYIEIHSGAGGTEACDWAQMLLRMYIRWGERRGGGVVGGGRCVGEEAWGW